jgi:hypothetical protein
MHLLDDQPNTACKPYKWDPRGTIPLCQSGTQQGRCDPVDLKCYQDPYDVDAITHKLLDIKELFDTSDAIKGLHALDQCVALTTL